MITFIKKIFIICSVLIFCTIAFARWNIQEKKYLDFSNAKNVEVTTPNNATKFEIEVANILEEELRKIISVTGYKKSNFSTSPKIAKIVLINSKKLDEDIPISKLIRRNKYSIRIGKNRVELEYPSADKIGWIVGKFLRDFCNIKYFSPTEFGSDYNEANLKFKVGQHHFSPSFFAAAFSDFSTSKRWRILNGIDTQYNYFKFSHNLNKIISPKNFSEYPHLFALKKNPDGSLSPNIYGQPDLLNYRTQNTVAETAIKHFNKNKAKMFSIGINDSQIVDEREEYLSYKDGYFRGYPNWSNSVFEFSNEVAKKVTQKNANAILGLLAYMICEKPPSFKLEKNLVPFYTTDRANNYDCKYQNTDLDILKKWGKSGVTTFGIYEYLYGAPYLMPRDFSDKSTLAIKEAHNAGARLYYAETFSIWGFDTKKMWITTRMLEDCSLDYSNLEKEFYLKYYRNASKPMQEFFDTANAIWKNRKIPTRWLAFYKAENTLELLNKARLTRMAEALEKASILAEKNDDKNVIKRVNEVTKYFEITQIAYQLYVTKIEMFDLLQAKCNVEKLILVLKKYDRIKSEFLEVQNKAMDKFNNSKSFDIYNQERFAPLDKIAEFLYKNGVSTKDLNKFNFKNIDFTSQFKAIEDVEISASVLYSISKWKNFKDNFSTIEKDFENAYMGEHQNSLTFKNCELSGIAKDFIISEKEKIVFKGNVENICTPGTLCYASLVFLDEKKNELKRKTLVFPSRKNIDFTLADTAPNNSKIANISVFATRQKIGDVFKVKSIDVKISK